MPCVTSHVIDHTWLPCMTSHVNKYDVMNGVIPPRNIQFILENELWNLFKGCIDEDIRKREEKAKKKKESEQKCSDWLNNQSKTS